MTRTLLVLSVALGGLVNGCTTPYRGDPTQATVEVTTTGPCGELGEVAIVTGDTPEATEQRASHEFYTATSKDCDPSRPLATLVVVPGGASASVIVIAAPSGGRVAQCKPPLYQGGCIVERRSFAFIENASLTVPNLARRQLPRRSV